MDFLIKFIGIMALGYTATILSMPLFKSMTKAGISAAAVFLIMSGIPLVTVILLSLLIF